MIPTALIGLGRIGYELEKDSKRDKPCTHLGTYLNFPGSFSLMGAYDVNPAKRFAFASAFPSIPLFESLEDLLQKGPQLLSIATPADTHLPLIKTICASPSKPRLIWLEKPVALDLKTANKIHALCKQAGIAVLVNHERRYDPQYQEVKKIIAQKSLGVLKSIHAQMYTTAHPDLPSSSGTLLEDGSHLIDMLLFLTDQKPLSHQTFIERNPGKKFESRLYGLLQFPEFPVFIDSGGDRKYFHFALELNFSQGHISIGNGFYHVFSAQNSPYYDRFKSLLPASDFVPPTPKNMFINLGEEIIRFFQTAAPLTSSLRDSLTVMEIIERLYKKSRLSA